MIPVYALIAVTALLVFFSLDRMNRLRRRGEWRPSDEREALDDERSQRIAQLEARLSQPSSVGVLPPVAGIALIVSLLMLWSERADIAYLMSPQEPIELGAEGDYRFADAVTNRYVRIHGTPTGAGTYWQEKANTFVAVGVRDTPLIVARVVLPSEAWKPGEKAPRPDQRSFTVKGRLLSRADAEKYEDAFKKHEAYGEIAPKWLLLGEVRPGGNFGTTAWLGLLAGLALLSAWLMAKGLVAMLRKG